VQQHLDLVERVFNKVKVYEIGFKPDQEIINMVKSMVDNERSL
jgi:hypothetical protein